MLSRLGAFFRREAFFFYHRAAIRFDGCRILKSLQRDVGVTSSTRAGLVRPGWPEILVGLVGLSILGIGGSAWIVSLSIEPMLIGLILTGMAGIGGLAGFYAAYVLRIRAWSAFGIRSTSRRWLVIAVAVGIFAFMAKSISILIFISFTGIDTDVQEIYGIGASGGLSTLILATLFLLVLTPIGEEFLFRGVIATALMLYGALVAVFGGALIFALFHGINTVFPAALVTGIIAGEIFRRSGSVWPAVVVHGVVNLPTVPALGSGPIKGFLRSA